MTEPGHTVASALEEGLARLDIAPDGEQRRRLLGLLSLLHKWNRAYNLTAVRSLDEMVPRHLLDSAAVLPHVSGPRLLDVGSGPGLPGLVLAILRPEMAVTLLDSNGKKVRFQRQAVLELGLTNVTPVQARVEAFQGHFDQLISRAFARLDDFVTLSDHLLEDGGQWLAMKGPAVAGELGGLPDTVSVAARHELAVPFETGSRQLVILERQVSTHGRPSGVRHPGSAE